MMPLVIVYTSSKEKTNAIKEILPQLRNFIAKELTCEERIIQPEEVSLQVLVSSTQLSIASIEVTIIAHSYPERIKKQDEICLAVKNFILSKNSSLGPVFVWIQLSELGHSLQE